LLLLILKKDEKVIVIPIIFINFLYVWLAHVVYMLEVIEESQNNTDIMTRHEAHGKHSLLGKRNTDDTRTSKQLTKN